METWKVSGYGLVNVSGRWPVPETGPRLVNKPSMTRRDYPPNGTCRRHGSTAAPALEIATGDCKVSFL